jgi:hypothetical protein
MNFPLLSPAENKTGIHFELKSRYIASAPTTQKTPHGCYCCVFIASLRGNGRFASGEFIGALLVAQQRAVNTRTSIVA